MIGYLDLPSGISGDMFLGCLLDAGWTLEQLKKTVEQLSLSSTEWAIEVKPVLKGALRAIRVEVLVDEGRHDRRLADITALIQKCTLPPIVKVRAVAIFTRLANAEARVHGSSPEDIHFHEVGAVDAIIDIVATVAGLHDLGIDQLYASALPLGPAWGTSAHGKIPMPAPATLELLAAVGAPTRAAPGPGELVTPTGAAILAELACFEQPQMRLSRIGVGCGEKDFAWPNIARLWIGEPDTVGQLLQMETNIDDMNPQMYAPLMQRLFNGGALDVWLTPTQMKKGRPGTILSLISTAPNEQRMADILLRESTTLGVRVFAVHRRHEARREIRRVQTPFGQVSVKLKWVGVDLIDASPEYEDCRGIAEQTGRTVQSGSSCRVCCRSIAAGTDAT
jgi:uncharacterized protein (TIGR00299 family) protein